MSAVPAGVDPRSQRKCSDTYFDGGHADGDRKLEDDVGAERPNLQVLGLSIDTFVGCRAGLVELELQVGSTEMVHWPIAHRPACRKVDERAPAAGFHGS